MNIDHFPPELLKIILSNEKITLKQRIALRGVCSHWLEVIEEHVLKKTTELVLSSDKRDGTESNRLPFKDELVPLIIRLFPKLTNLSSVNSNFEMPYKALPRLLTAFSTTLTTLKLDLCNVLFHIKDNDHQLNQLILDLTTAINSLSSLTTLDLKLCETLMIPQLLPTLARLRRFYCCFSYTTVPSQFWQTITANTSLPTLTTLEIEQNSDDYASAVADLVTTFPSLQSLKLRLDSFEYYWNNLPADIFPHLASLQHLTELNLVDNLYFPEGEPLPLPSSTDQRLTQVKKFTLKYFNDLDKLTTILIAWFPSLEVLYLRQKHYGRSDLSNGPHLTNTTLHNLARLEQLIELDLSDSSHKCILNNANLMSPPLPTDRPIVGLKRLHLQLGEDYSTAKPICTSALVAWFPSLQYLNLMVFDDSFAKDLTTSMLQDICQLKSLVELELSVMRYQKKDLEPPLSFDRPLACLKELKLKIIHPPKDFDGSYFCSTVTAWFPALEVLNITFYCNEGAESYESYETASEAIRNGFGSSVNLNISLEV